MRVLSITYGLPWPLTEGAKIRDFHLLRELARSAEVSVLSLCKDDRHPAKSPELKRFCAVVETFTPPVRGAWATLREGWSPRRPVAAAPFFFEAFAARIGALALQHRAQIVQFEHTFLAPYVVFVPKTCKKVLSLHNIGELQYARMAQLSGAGPLARMKALAMRGWEGDWARRFDACIAVSESDAGWVRRHAPDVPVTVIDNGVDCETLRPLAPAGGCEVLFIGVLGYRPNADAVVHFARQAMPLLRRTVPEARFIVAGRNPGADVRALAEAGAIELHSDVPDVLPLYQRARVCVVPLRAGGGTRLKIPEAMALGRPVVSTTLGCEGLEVEHERQLLIADGAEALAAQTARLLRQPDLARELTARARTWVEQRHDWRKLGARLAALHQSMAAPGVRA